jgi:hypothetical protein
MIPIAIAKHTPMAIIWNLAALISSSWNLPNDELALKNELNRLESSWSSLDWWLNFWTLVVVIGVAVELVVIIVEYRHEMHDFRRGIMRPPDRPSRLLLIFGLLGAGLVAVGVAGEFFIHTKAGRVETEMRDDTGKLVAIVNGKAEGAKERADQFESDNTKLRTDLTKEERKTAEAQKEAAEAQEEERHSTYLAFKRTGNRTVDRLAFLKALKGKKTGSVEIWYI